MDVVPVCPSGNCTFPAFQTLVVCQKCGDVTDLIAKECFGWKRRGADSTTCRYKLLNSLQINLTMFLYEKDGTRNFGTRSNIAHSQTAAISAGLPFARNMSHSARIVPLTVLNGSTAERRFSAHAMQCALYWCVKTIEAHVVNGQLAEPELTSWYNEVPSSFKLSQRGQTLASKLDKRIKSFRHH